MTIYGQSARTLRRYGPWTLVVTTAAIAAAYALNQSLPPGYASEATVLVEARHAATRPATGPGAAPATAPGGPVPAPVTPDIRTERRIALSDAVVLPAAGRIGLTTGAFREDLTVEVVPDTHILRIVYTADNRHSAQLRARALVEAYAGFRSTGPVTVTPITDAALPDESPARPLLPDLAAGLAAGLLLGAGTALLRARTRGLIRSRDDFAALAGVPVLATIPRYRGPDGEPVTVHQPDSPAAEAYRYLRARLQPSLRPTSATTILVTSPGDRQGRTTVAADLAVTLARTGRSVILVDADLRRPRLHQIFTISGEYGLTALLDGDAGVPDVLEDTRIRNLRVIPAGDPEGDYTDLLGGAPLARTLLAVQRQADVVILDSSAVLTTSSAITLAAHADQVLLVADFTRTTRESVRRALAELTEATHGNVRPILVNVPKSAGALIPRARAHATATVAGPLTRDRLVSDADDVAPPGVTSHTYVDVDTDEDKKDPLADYYARTATVAVPVIYGSAQPTTVYAATYISSAASDGPSSPTSTSALTAPAPTDAAPVLRASAPSTAPPTTADASTTTRTSTATEPVADAEAEAAKPEKKQE